MFVEVSYWCYLLVLVYMAHTGEGLQSKPGPIGEAHPPRPGGKHTYYLTFPTLFNAMCYVLCHLADTFIQSGFQ